MIVAQLINKFIPSFMETES